GLAAGLVGILNQTSIPVPMTLAAPSLLAVAIPVAAGILITVIASLAPARRSTRVAPLAALRPDAPAPVRSKAGGRRIASGVCLLGLGAATMASAMASGSVLLGTAGGVVTFVGVLALAPIVIPAAIVALGACRRVLPPDWRGGVPAELSVANAVRNPRRTAATASALLIGVTLISVLVVGASSVSASSAKALDHNNPVDLTVISTDALPTELAARVRNGKDVTQVVALRGVTARAGRLPLMVASVSGREADSVVRDPELRDLLSSGMAVVPVSYAGPPAKVTLVVGGSSVALPITYSSLADGPILIPARAMAELGGPRQTVGLWIKVAADADARSVLSDLEDTLSASGPTISGGYLERASLDKAINAMLLIATALLAVAALIALVGVSNTLQLSVIERTREQALLRALGLTRAQLRGMLAGEAVLMAVVAAFLGVGLGIVLGWAGTVTVIGRVTSQSAVLDIPWIWLAGIVAVASVAGLIASLLPGRGAARVSLARGLAEE
ncbi:MAG: ABC transporter permease, partial [Propionibacteriales bacterium]|nr:ABC transporter permease [Propionibacteriales bacterium]